MEKAMFRHLQSVVSTAALALVGLLSVARSVPAQGPAGYYYETFRYGYNPGYYARRVVVPGHGDAAFGPYGVRTKTSPGAVAEGAYLHYASAGVGQSPAGANRLSLTRASPAPATGTARLEVRVPDGSEVWFGAVRTEQPGVRRYYESPPLAPDRDYAYQIRVVWKVDGRAVAESRNVTVHAGDELIETFPAAAGGQ
jgi:uncharacterized protein (TIGR03000 family)